MKLNLVSGPVTGGWYVGMGVVGKIITSAYPDTEITMLPGGSTVNPIRLDRGQADIGILQIAMGSVARKGEAPFKAPVKNVAQLVCWNDLSPINIVVREDLGVNSIEELRDRKVPVRLAVGMKGGGGDSYGRWLFGEYGFTFKDIEDWGGQVYFNNYDDMTNLAKDGLVDMIVWLGRPRRRRTKSPARMATMRQRQTHPPSSGIAMATNQCWRRSGGRFRDCRMSRMRRRCCGCCWKGRA